jgi:hypothetical protein
MNLRELELCAVDNFGWDRRPSRQATQEGQSGSDGIAIGEGLLVPFHVPSAGLSVRMTRVAIFIR